MSWITRAEFSYRLDVYESRLITCSFLELIEKDMADDTLPPWAEKLARDLEQEARETAQWQRYDEEEDQRPEEELLDEFQRYLEETLNARRIGLRCVGLGL